MDNKNFEQQFVQNLKTSQLQPATNNDNSKRQTIVMIVLAVVTLMESIILIIVLSQYFSLVNGDYSNEAYLEEDVSDVVEEPDYIYNENDELTAFNVECKNENGSYIKLDTNNSYELYNSTSGAKSTGTYSMTRGSIISLNGDNAKTVFYDGFIITDGATIFDCWEELNEVETE